MGANNTAVIQRPRIAGRQPLGLRRPEATARVETAMPLGERGYVNGAGNSNAWLAWDPFEKVPQLQWPEAISVYLDMDNDDSRVTSLLESISLPILSAKWRIDPNGAPADAVQLVSRNLRVPVVGEDEVDDGGRSKGRFSFLAHLRDVASPVPQFGHAAFEQVYRREADGRFVLRKLGPRPQWTIQNFNTAQDGGLDSITQLAPASTGKIMFGINPLDIAINRLVVYARNKRPGRWEGRSVLRSSYKHWLLKNELLKIEVAVARRNGMGVPVGTASKPNDPAEVKAMQRIASGFRGGLHSGVGLAAGQSLTLLGVQGNLPDIRASIEYHDKAIGSRAWRISSTSTEAASYALASVQERPFVQALNASALYYAEIAQAHIIEDLVDVNFGTDTRCPRIVFSPIGSQQDATAASLKMLVEAGLLAPDMRIERALRQLLDLPAKPDEDDPDAEPPAGEPEPTPRRPRRRPPSPRRTTVPDGRRQVVQVVAGGQGRRRQQAKRTTLHIYDVIGADVFFGGVDVQELVTAIEELDDDTEVDIRINSPGGAAWDGLTLANAIIRHPGTTRSYVDGLAASAASLVALATDEVIVSRYGQMMLHNARGGLYGTAEELKAAADTLAKLNGSMADYYADRAGGEPAAWARAMKRETWYSAEEAKEAGLATEIDDSGKREEVEAAASAAIAKAAAMFTYAGRQNAPAPTARVEDGPEGPEPQEEATVPISKQVAERLGLGEDATDEDVIAKIGELETAKADEPDEDPADDTVDPAEVEAATKAAAKLGLTLVDPGTLAEMQANSALGAAAHAKLETQRVTAAVDAAIGLGKIPAARKDHWVALMRADEVGTTKLLADIPAETECAPHRARSRPRTDRPRRRAGRRRHRGPPLSGVVGRVAARGNLRRT